MRDDVMTETAKGARDATRRSRGPRTAADDAPLTAEVIVTAGVQLTATHGLAGWSTRDLAAEVGCWPTAIVHRIGPRQEVERAVVDAVLRQVDLPSPDLAWRPWYAELLTSLHQTLAHYSGVARWLGMAATTVPAAVTIIDVGVGKLDEVGLGDDAPAAHITLLNTAVHLITAADERDTDPQLNESIRASLTNLRDSTTQPGAAAFARALTNGIGADDLYRYAVDRALDGIAARIAALTTNTEGAPQHDDRQ